MKKCIKRSIPANAARGLIKQAVHKATLGKATEQLLAIRSVLLEQLARVEGILRKRGDLPSTRNYDHIKLAFQEEKEAASHTTVVEPDKE